jgi:uncharacterized membrane protein YcaP (DUF421 family)
MPFFDSWRSLAGTAFAGIVSYTALVVFLRVSGKRTLAKMNAFDLVVTVALGSTLASVLTSDRLPLANGLLALALLILLQYVVAWASQRSVWFRHLVKSEPTVLFADGQFLADVLTAQRVGRDEVLAAIRGAGHRDLAEVAAVVLETDGSFSVLGRTDGGVAASSLHDAEHERLVRGS